MKFVWKLLSLWSLSPFMKQPSHVCVTKDPIHLFTVSQRWWHCLPTPFPHIYYSHFQSVDQVPSSSNLLIYVYCTKKTVGLLSPFLFASGIIHLTSWYFSTHISNICILFAVKVSFCWKWCEEVWSCLPK